MPPLPPEDLQHVLDHTRDLWDELRGQRIFVTGGTGFFGCWLLETFAYANDQLGLNAELTALTRDPAAFARKAPHLRAHPAIQLLQGDVCDFPFPDGTFSHVIHAATTASPSVPPLVMLETIINGTRRALDFSVACGAKKFLLPSSGAVYGRQPPELMQIPESYSGAPDPSDTGSAYGEGKRVAELLCAIYAREHGMEAKIARCFAFVGPHLPLDAHFAIGNFIRDALRGGPIRIQGDGTPLRSYLYASDLAIWLWTILFKGKSLQPYNVGSDQAISIADLARTVAEVINPAVKIQISRSATAGLPSLYVPCVKLAKKELGITRWTALKKAISQTHAWHSGIS